MDAVDEFISADAITYSAPSGSTPGPEDAKQQISMFFSEFPDIHVTVEDEITEWDKVVSRLSACRGHTKESSSALPQQVRKSP